MSGKKVNIAQGGMRGEAKKTKVVFKNVLDTPFNIQWPEVTADNNAIVLDTVCDMVKSIRDYHNTRPKQDAKPDKKQKKSSAKDTAGSASSKPSTALATLANSSPSATASEPSTGTSAESTAPAILKSTILGINAITKALERSIQDLAAHPPPTAIILCKGDLIPSHLYAHLGPMIAMLPGVLLFPLLKGSERRLSEALGLPAVGALAIQSTEGSREAEDLIMILKGMVEPMTASWLPKVTPKPLAKDKSQKQPAATGPKSATTSEVGAGTVSAAATAPVSTSGKTTEAPKPAVQQAEFIATSIKTIKTTMPIVVKTPKPAQTDNSTTNKNNNNNKGNGQGQQQQQQKQKQQQNQSQSHNHNPKQKQQQQANQGKNKKPPVESLDGDRGQVKKAKSN
ncbi:hypothetical protein KI688_000844 [Linnemannia hyalina]|uniref:Uncharacterized protein n=1 Tax=Linnemannia hyalina TaxID=64524 RepID=A0A9P8BXV9_9FUNG|nr:hypothetical protein KI688_000844 [Linnemannia hyalina]